MVTKIARAGTKVKAKIFLVEDHPIVRKGLADMIAHAAGLEVCGEAESAEDARAQIAVAKPDLVITDLSLKEAGGMDLIKDLQIRCPKMPVLVISMHDEALFAERALRAGAKGYVMKQEAVNEVVTAIRTVLKGKVYLSSSMSERMLQTVACGRKSSDKPPLERLSDREMEVFNLIGRGVGTQEAAQKLHLSVKTVETHRAHIKEKLKLPNAIQLVRYATQWVERG